MTPARIGVIGREFRYFGINEVITAHLTRLHPGAIGEFFGGVNGAKQLLLEKSILSPASSQSRIHLPAASRFVTTFLTQQPDGVNDNGHGAAFVNDRSANRANPAQAGSDY